MVWCSVVWCGVVWFSFLPTPFFNHPNSPQSANSLHSFTPSKSFHSTSPIPSPPSLQAWRERPSTTRRYRLRSTAKRNTTCGTTSSSSSSSRCVWGGGGGEDGWRGGKNGRKKRDEGKNGEKGGREEWKEGEETGGFLGSFL